MLSNVFYPTIVSYQYQVIQLDTKYFEPNSSADSRVLKRTGIGGSGRVCERVKTGQKEAFFTRSTYKKQGFSM